MIKKKVYISISGLLAVLLLIGGAFFMFRQAKTELTIEQYNSELETLLNNIRSGQEKWDELLGGESGASFQDLCTGFYSAKFRSLGQVFIEEAEKFENLHIKNANPAEVIANYHSYVSFFGTYRSIGDELINFASRVDEGEYNAAVSILETIISLYDTLPNLY